MQNAKAKNMNFEPLPKLELDSRKRFRVKFCPCGKSNKDGKFVPYRDHDDKGYCHGCGETFLPKIERREQWQQPQRNPEPLKEYIYIDPKDVNKAITGQDNFSKYLHALFDEATANGLIQRYRIGVSNRRWQGATVFFQIDNLGKVRRGTVILYDAQTGKRQKNDEGAAYISSIHAIKGISECKPPECLFGLHLLNDSTRPIAIVEAPKTAIIASAYLPQFTWMACGGLANIKPLMLAPLAGRQIILFPDLGGFEKWNERAKEISGISIKVSDYLELNATVEDRSQKLDIADYLISQNVNSFGNYIETLQDGSTIELTPYAYPAMWDQPCERNEVNDYWRYANWACELEAAKVSRQFDKGDKILAEMAAKGFHEMPEDILQQYAPSLFNQMN